VLEKLSCPPVYSDAKVRMGNPTKVKEYILNLDIIGERLHFHHVKALLGDVPKIHDC
jgi:hypothetical protein